MRRVTTAVGMIAVFAAAAVAAPLTKGRALAIMHQRHEGMEKIGDTNKLLRREITSSSPFVPAIQSGAATIAGLSVKANGWFPRGTGPELGKTGARPQIWQTPQDFIAKLHNFQGAAQAFNAAAKSGDMNAIKARYADLNGACKACHDKYRMDMHH
jgi:cytochrome c556